MRLKLFLILSILPFVFASCQKESELSEDRESDGPVIYYDPASSVNGEILLKIKPTGTKSTDAPDSMISEEVMQAFSNKSQFHIERLFPESGRYEARTKAEGLDLWYIATFDEKEDVSEIVNCLKACRSIEAIECCQPLNLDYSYASATSISSDLTKADNGRNASFPFNESLDARTRQWHYHNIGDVLGIPSKEGADAGVWPAWKKCTGNSDVIVAVVDQGVYCQHEDLADNMWVNEDEIPGNGIDDDGNGYVDDYYGYNFIDDNGHIWASSDYSHATHVAGTIAAVNNNGKGVNGIAGGSGNSDGVRIMSLQSIGVHEDGSAGGSVASVARAMKYAADNGAVICQNSWGYATKISSTTWRYSLYGALARAMDYFIKYAGVDENGQQIGPMKGGIIVFAAGNEAIGYPRYPAADDSVVNVASITCHGSEAYYTNYGPWVRMSAPGGDIFTEADHCGMYSTIVGPDGKSGYGYMQGTSMACPHVSGACALAVSYYYGKDKRMGLTPEKLKNALYSSTKNVNAGLSKTYFGNMGIGMLDTGALLEYMDYLDEILPLTLKVGETVSIKLSDYFPDNNSFTMKVSDRKILEAQLSDGELKITALNRGLAKVTIGDGKSLSKEIEITVE